MTAKRLAPHNESFRGASKKRPIAVVAMTLAALLATAAPLAAELPGTQYVFPLGGQRGTQVAVRIGGYYLHEGASFAVNGPNVAASPRIERTERIWFEGPLIYQPASQGKEDYPADYAGRIDINPDAAPGIRRWSVHTPQGVTPGLPFLIGRFPQVVEQEVDGKPIPVAVTLPTVVNGRIFPRQDVDIWTFDALAGQTVTCAVLAARVGSPLVSRLEIRDPSGKPVGEDVGSTAGDAFVQFRAPVSGRYAVHIHDADFAGLQHHVYRLLITSGPFVNGVFPLGGRRGESLTVALRGVNLPTTTADIRVPDNAGDVVWWHPEGFGADELGIPLEISNASAMNEIEPNDATANPQALAWSEGQEIVVDGRVDSPGDVDQFAIDAKPGTPVRVFVRAAALGSLLDSVLTVIGPNGQVVAQADDANGNPDASLTFTPPLEGRYLVAVRDRIAHRGGPEYAYRLHVAVGEERPAVPFTLRLGSDVLNIDRGGQGTLKVDVQRFGFNDPIELACDGLPADVTISGNALAAGANQATLTFKAEPKAKLGLHSLRIIGAAKRDGQETRSVATSPSLPSEADRDAVLLSINVPTPFKIRGDFESKYSPRGSVFVRHYFIDRNGFDGPLEVSLADRQFRHLQGVTGPKITVPAGVDEFDYPLQLAPRMEIGRTSRTCVMVVGEVTLDDGAKAKVAYSSQEQNEQIIVITAPERMQISLSADSILFEPGKEIELDVRVERDRALTRPTRLELICPAHLPIAAADPVTISAAQTTGRLTLRFRDEPPGPINMPATIRAVTTDERGYPVVAEALLEFVAPSDQGEPSP
jgi:hypothetical protein